MAAECGEVRAENHDPLGRVAELADAFKAHEAQLLAGWRTVLEQHAARGPVALWGAGAKGVTFANLLDPETRRIVCIVDVNPAKQGHWLPGTGHPVVAPSELAARSVRSILLLNPNYREEIDREVARLGLEAQVIDLMSQSPA
jgi:hypothetical protein